MKAISPRYPLQNRRRLPCVAGVLGCRNQFPTVSDSDASGMSASLFAFDNCSIVIFGISVAFLVALRYDAPCIMVRQSEVLTLTCLPRLSLRNPSTC